MNADTLARIRLVVLGLAGAICAAYAQLAVLWNTPQPFTVWGPAAAGITASVVIWVSAFVAGERNTGIAMDELYKREWGLSVQFSYWFGIVLFILAAVAVAKGMISQSTGVAAFGTAYGASPMLAFCIISLRS